MPLDDALPETIASAIRDSEAAVGDGNSCTWQSRHRPLAPAGF
jgi:hypothetical protein